MSDPLSAAVNAAKAIIAAKNGSYLEAAGHAADMALDLVPHTEARKVLDEAIFRRVNAEAELAERIKFGERDEP